MKKRLLSAALALAMVLTLLPVSAFAAGYQDPTELNPNAASWTDSKGVSHPYYDVQNQGQPNQSITTVSVQYQAASDPTTKRAAGYWYWLDNKTPGVDPIYHYVNTGVVVGTGTSGNWYPNVDALVRTETNGTSLTSTSFTLLSNQEIPSATLSDSNLRCPTSLTIDVNGFALTLPNTLPDKFSSLTITNRLNPRTHGGSVNGIAKNIATQNTVTGVSKSWSALTLNVSNTTITGAITLQGGSNNVTLNNVVVQGGITMDGHTTILRDSVQTSERWDGQRLNVNVNDKGNVSTTASFTDALTITGDNSTVNLNNVTGGQALSVTGNGGTITVDGATLIGAVNVSTRNGSGDRNQVPSVTVNGGTVGTITRATTDSTQENQVTINAGATAYAVVTPKGRVTVNQGSVTDAIVVNEGSVDLKGPVVVGTTATALKLGAIGVTNLSISGTGNKIGGVTAENGNNLKINAWPAGRDNYFGTLALTENYKGRGVTGGRFSKTGNATNFADPNKAEWFSTNLQLVVVTDSLVADTLSLYGKDEMARAISDVTSIAAGITPKALMHILCQESTYTLVLSNGNINWAEIGYDKPTGMILPTEINGFGIAKWISGDNDASVPSGTEQIIPKPSANNVFTLMANDVSPTVAKSITQAAPSKNNTVENQHVKVSVNGTNIQISGAVKPAAGSNIATILLDLTTDALVAGGPNAPASGEYVVLRDVQVFYNVDTKAIGFNRLQSISGGAIINDAGELVLNNGTGTHYTVSGTLSQSASNLGLYLDGQEIQATIGGNLSRRTQTDKDNIMAQIAGNGASFNINGNRAVQEAINAAQATITSNNSVESWVTNARNYVWRNGNKYLNTKGQPNGLGKGDPNDVIDPHTGNFSTTGTFGADGQDIATKYQKAYIVPYLVVNATDLNQNGTLTATLTVYYRVDVSGADYNPNEYYTVQTGRTLGALTGDMATPVKVTFSSAGSAFANSNYMHQDGKYVYTKDGNGAWSIDHAGTGTGNLGTIVLNTTDGPITLKRASGTTEPTKYDTLQAAIDDTRPGWTNNINGAGGNAPSEVMDEVTIGGTYAETNCVVTMTGVARKIKVVSNGNRKLTSNTKDVDVQTYNGFDYTIQLQKDAVTSGTVAIAVTPSGSGTASANRSVAKVGETVIVTTVPAAGQAVTGITAKTNTGAAVTVSSNGTVNQYKFVVPANATSVTVTPVFGVATAANLTISTSNYGLAATNATQVYGGQEVTITTTPYTGYRTTGVTVSTNAGNLTATRTANNVYKFTVPVNATYVTVTPTFAADSGLPFTDVPANSSYVDAVRFVYNNSLMNGKTPSTFAGGDSITRGQIVTILYRLSGSPTASSYSSFQDVPANEYYAPAITWAANNKIVNGRSTTSFAPNDAITRQELAAILYRYSSFRGITGVSQGSLNNFTDRGQVDSYATNAMAWCVGNGIINGTTATTLTPRGTATRYQAATMLMRYCQAFLNM